MENLHETEIDILEFQVCKRSCFQFVYVFHKLFKNLLQIFMSRQNKKVEEDAKFQKLQKEREELTKKSTDQNTQFNEEQLKIQKQELDIGKKQKAASDEHFQTNKKNLEEQKKSIIKQQKDTEK